MYPSRELCVRRIDVGRLFAKSLVGENVDCYADGDGGQQELEPERLYDSEDAVEYCAP